MMRSKISQILSIPREGLYIDPLLSLLNSTIFSPHLLLPAALFFHREAAAQPRLAVLSKLLLAFSLLYRINNWLNHWARNNWTRANDWNDWESELVVVTGGSSGIGASVAKSLAVRGTRIAVIDIEPLGYDADPNIHFYRCDLTQPSMINSVCRRIQSELGHPTVLINNAGLTRGRNLIFTTENDVALTLHTNLHAHFHLLREFLPKMVEANHGHIVTVASAAGYIGPPGLVDYAASKAGAIAVHEGLGLELIHHYNAPRVRTTLICPSFANTPMFKGKTDQPWFLMPLLHTDTVGDAIVQQVLSGYGKTVFLPGFMGLMPIAKALPYWIQGVFKDGAAKTSVDFKGRQKVGRDGRLIAEKK